jgi:hypothetical protein
MINVPEDIRDRFARVCATFKMRYPDVDIEDVQEFMLDVIQIYSDFYQEEEKRVRDKAIEESVQRMRKAIEIRDSRSWQSRREE